MDSRSAFILSKSYGSLKVTFDLTLHGLEPEMFWVLYVCDKSNREANICSGLGLLQS